MILEIMFFLYFPDGNWPTWWIIKSIKFYMLTQLGGMRNITMPKILRFFDFPNGRLHYLLFLPRDSYAKRGICHRHVSVCVSVTLRYCIKKAKHRITQTMPHDSPMTLVFWRQRSWRNSNGITPYSCDKCRWGGLKLVTFEEKRAITRKQYKIDV